MGTKDTYYNKCMVLKIKIFHSHTERHVHGK